MSFPVTIRYWAGARAAAGVDSETVQAGSVSSAIEQVRRRHGPELSKVVAVCSVLVNGVTQRHDDLSAPLQGRVEVELLPPFAGG